MFQPSKAPVCSGTLEVTYMFLRARWFFVAATLGLVVIAAVMFVPPSDLIQGQTEVSSKNGKTFEIAGTWPVSGEGYVGLRGCRLDLRHYPDAKRTNPDAEMQRMTMTLTFTEQAIVDLKPDRVDNALFWMSAHRANQSVKMAFKWVELDNDFHVIHLQCPSISEESFHQIAVKVVGSIKPLY